MYSSAGPPATPATPPPSQEFPPPPPEGCEVITCKTGCRFFREAARAGNSTADFCTQAFFFQLNQTGFDGTEYNVLRRYRDDKCRVSCGPFLFGESVLRCEDDDNPYGRRYVLRSNIPCERDVYGKGEYTCRTFGRTEEDCNPMPDMPPPMMVEDDQSGTVDVVVTPVGPVPAEP